MDVFAVTLELEVKTVHSKGGKDMVGNQGQGVCMKENKGAAGYVQCFLTVTSFVTFPGAKKNPA